MATLTLADGRVLVFCNACEWGHAYDNQETARREYVVHNCEGSK